MRLAPHLAAAALAVAACQPLDEVGRAPSFTPADQGPEQAALYRMPVPERAANDGPGSGASLWSASGRALLGDRRAAQPGDILTVVIEIDDSAAISNATSRGRAGSNSLGVPQLFGVPQAIDRRLPGGLSVQAGGETDSSTDFSGNGSVERNEQLELRLAATVVERLPNDVMRIEGRQEIRVNHELRELLVTGHVRPQDISRANEVTYDKIANARISYGGRGVVSNVQQPRYGAQILDILSPF